MLLLIAIAFPTLPQFGRPSGNVRSRGMWSQARHEMDGMRLTRHVNPSAILNFHAFNRVSVKEQKLKPPHTTKPTNGVAVGVRGGIVAIRTPVGEGGP